MARGKTTQAIENYRLLIDEEPDNGDLHYQLAKIQFEMGSFEKALKSIRKAIIIDSMIDQYRLLAGKIYFFSQDFFEAINHLSGALLINNRLLEGYYYLARAYAKTGKTAEALKQLEAAIAIEPLYFEAHLEWVSISFRQGEKQSGSQETTEKRYSKLISKLQNALIIKPNSIDGNLLLSEIYFSMGAKHKSKVVLESWLEKFPQNDKILLASAKLEYQAGEFNEAQRILLGLEHPNLDSKILLLKIQRHIAPKLDLVAKAKQLLIQHPSSAELLLLHGELELEQGNLAQAERIFKKILNNDPDYAEAYYWQSKVLEAQNDFFGAQWALKKALNLAPTSFKVRIHYLEGLVREGKTAEAQDLLSTYSFDPNNPDVLLLKGIIAKENQEFKLAEQLLLKAGKKQYSLEIEVQLADIEIRQGKYHAAENRLKQMNAFLPDNIEIVLVKAKLYFHTSRIEKIPPLLQPYLENRLGKGRSHLLTAESLAQLGKINESLRVLEEGLKLWPRDPELVQAYTFFLGLKKKYAQAIRIIEDMQTYRHKYNRLFFYRLRAFYYHTEDFEKFRNYPHQYKFGFEHLK